MSSKIECTAVNELIDLVHKKPLDLDSGRDSSQDMLFAPPREASLRRPAAGTQPPPMGPQKLNLFAVELPAFKPVAPTTGAPVPAPVAAEEDIDTTYVPKLAPVESLPLPWKKLAIGGGAIVLIAIVAAVKLGGSGAAERQNPIVAVAPAPTLIVTPVPPPPVAPKPKLVDVRLSSTPAGATATLLDTATGNSLLLGSTPVDATVDPTKAYDVRFELDGRPSATEHLDPTKPVLEVAMGDPEPAAAPAPVVAEKHHRHHNSAAAKKAKRVAVVTPAPKRRTSDAAAPADEPGWIAITTSAPCAILLDGTNTGKTSPTKLSVPAGHHSLRLIAATQHINKQISVDVAAKKTVRVSD